MSFDEFKYRVLSNYPYGDAYGLYFLGEGYNFSDKYPGISQIDGSDLYSITEVDKTIDSLNPGFAWPYKNISIMFTGIELENTVNKDTINSGIEIWFFDQRTTIGDEIHQASSADGLEEITTNDSKIFHLLKDDTGDCYEGWFYDWFSEWAETLYGWDIAGDWGTRIGYHGDGVTTNCDPQDGSYYEGTQFNEEECYHINQTLGYGGHPVLFDIFGENQRYYTGQHFSYSDCVDIYTDQGYSFGTNIDTDLINFDNQINSRTVDVTNENYIIVVKMRGDQESWGDNWNNRNRRWQKIYIPKSYFHELVYNKDVEKLVLHVRNNTSNYYEYNSAGYYDIDDQLVQSIGVLQPVGSWEDDYGVGGWADTTSAPAYTLKGFEIILFGPTGLKGTDVDSEIGWTGNEGGFGYNYVYSPLNTEYADSVSLKDYMNWPVWVNDSDIDNVDNIKNINTNNKIDYLTSDNFGLNHIEDFLPIPHVYAEFGTTKFNCMKYYDSDEEGFDFVGAPNIINISFDIAKGGVFSHQQIPSILPDNAWVGTLAKNHSYNNYKPIGYKFAVARWGSEVDMLGSIPTSSDSIIDELDSFKNDVSGVFGSLINYRNTYDLYKWMDVRDGSDYFTLNHQYTKPGRYNLKVIVFSYYYSDEYEVFQALKFRVVDIFINLNQFEFLFDDFGELGGPNFTVLPWPYPSKTPIIGGISEESKYWKSLENVVKAGNFHPNEIQDLTYADNAYKNTELGDHLGEVDLSQTRYFVGPKDMNQLLLMNSDEYMNGEYQPYWNYNYWHGDEDDNKYPDNSCVSLIFINDSSTKELRDDCIIEFNYELADGSFVLDSNGNANRGIIIGDYSVKKSNKTTPLVRDSSMKLPKIVKGKDDGAF